MGIAYETALVALLQRRRWRLAPRGSCPQDYRAGESWRTRPGATLWRRL